MARADHRMVDVELVGGLPPDEPDEPVARSAAAAAWWVRRWRPLAAATVLLAVGSLGAWSLRSEAYAVRADDTVVAAHAGIAGIARNLREPLTQRWGAAAPGSIVGDLVLTSTATELGPRIVARDAVTGQARWTAPASVDPAGRGLHCPATAMRATVLLCDVPGLPGLGAPHTDAVLGGTPDRLVALRSADGQVVAQREFGPTVIGWAVLDDDVVVAHRDGATAYLERSALLGARSSWRTELPLPPDLLARDLSVMASDGFVILAGPVAAVLDARGGAVLGTWESAEGRLPVQVVTSSIGFAVWTTPLAGIWFDRAGAAGSHLAGAPVVAGVDDGSQPRILLVQDDRVLRAVDVYSGLLWEASRVHRLAVRLDGLVLLEGGGALRAVDLRSGDERWSKDSAVASIAGSPAVTDGVRFLVVEPRDAAGGLDASDLTAYDLSDGARRWSVPFPARFTELSIGAGLLVSTDDTLTVFAG